MAVRTIPCTRRLAARHRRSAQYPRGMRLPAPRAALVALLALAAAAPTASAGTLDVSRRVDPTLDPYMFTESAKTPLSAMTPAQQWLATNAKPLVVHDSEPRLSLNLLGWAQRPSAAAYYNGTGVNTSRAIQMQQAKAWLVTKNGKPVLVDGGWQMLDLRKPAARLWWLYGTDKKATCNPDRDQRAALDLLACGYSGLWIDNALTTPKQGFTPTPNIDERSWAKGVLTALKMLHQRKPKGTTFTINMHWTDTDYGYSPKPKLHPKEAVIRAAQYADQVIIEGGAIDPGLHYALPAKAPWSYRRLLTFADAMHKVRVHLQWEKTSSSDLVKGRTPISGAPQLPSIPSCRDGELGYKWTAGDLVWQAHVRSAAFNFATAVLTWKKGDSVGDMCEYPDRGWTGYHANLGKPSGRRSESGGLIRRKLQRGLVIVNPADTAKRVTLPKAGINLADTTWPVTSTKVSSVVIGPRSAAVIQY